MQKKETPLHYAAQNGHSESVQLLLAAKSNIHAEAAVSYSLLEIMVELCGAEPRCLDWCSTSTPRYTGQLRMDTVRQCSYYSLQRAMLMLRTGSVPHSFKLWWSCVVLSSVV